MDWIILSIFTAFFHSFVDIIAKYALKYTDEYTLSFVNRMIVSLLLLPFVISEGIPKIGLTYLWALIVDSIIFAISVILYYRAIKNNNLSLVVPMIAFTPVFLLITSPILLDEFPNRFGLVGMCFVVVGSYMINIDKKKHGYLEPFKNLLKNNGTKMMLFVAALWSILANVDKIGMNSSSLFFWLFSIYLGSAVLMIPKVKFESIEKKGILIIIMCSIFLFLLSVIQLSALKTGMVPYVISIKRLSVLITVILGHFLFREINFKQRFTAAILMVIGVIIITVFG